MIKNNSAYDAEYSNGLLAIQIRGEIDHHSAAGLRAGMDAEIFKHRPSKLILDLSEVEFMDSSGLGLILGRYAVLKDIGGELVLLNPGKGVLKILKLAGAERILKIEYLDLEKGRNQGETKGRVKRKT
ncbi:MAG: anti-sigma factor antagonist [Clostridia bacterium]|nr:anti-sigma factor antagonist [Clostridia bacterium]